MSEEKQKTKGRFLYANGMSSSQCKKICQFFFASFFWRMDIDKHQQRFILYIFKEIKTGKKGEVMKLEDYIDVDYFKEFWCTQGESWKVVIVDKEPEL